MRALPFLLIAALSNHATAEERPGFCSTWLEKQLSEKEYGRKLATSFKKSSLYSLHEPRPEIAQKRNLEILTAMKGLPYPENLGRRTSLSESEANALFDEVMANPVVQKQGGLKRNVGICFALAVAAHLHALRAKIDKRSIAKVFAIGRFSDGGRLWDYHVAPIVRANDHGWWVIDLVFGKVMKLEDWHRRLQGMEQPSQRNMNLYVTEAKRFLPSTRDPYTIDPEKKFNLQNPIYKDYFTDLLQYFRNEQPKSDLPQ